MRLPRSLHASRSLAMLLLVGLASAACGADDPVKPQPSLDLRGVWDVRDTAQMEYDVPGGTRRVLTELWLGDMTVSPSGRSANDFFLQPGTVADSMCDGAACFSSSPGAPGLPLGPRAARADGTRLLGFGLAFEVPARAVTDSGIHWIATVDAGASRACEMLGLVFNAPQGARRCRVATHWRRRSPPAP